MEVIREFYGAITFNVKNSKDVRENGKIELKVEYEKSKQDDTTCGQNYRYPFHSKSAGADCPRRLQFNPSCESSEHNYVVQPV